MKTMTLNLPEREMDYLNTASRAAGMSKTAFVKRALRLYDMVQARLDETDEALRCRTIDWNECRESMQSWAARARKAESGLADVLALADRWEERSLEVDSFADSAEDRILSACLNSAATELRGAAAGEGDEVTG